MSEQIRRLILTCPCCLEHQPRQKQAAVIPVTTTNQAHSGLRHFSACWSIVQLHRRLPHKVPVGEANQEPRSRYSDPTFSECLQPVWLAYGGSDQSRLSVHFQRLARTLLEIQHRPQARVPSPSVEEQPLRKCHW